MGQERLTKADNLGLGHSHDHRHEAFLLAVLEVGSPWRKIGGKRKETMVVLRESAKKLLWADVEVSSTTPRSF